MCCDIIECAVIDFHVSPSLAGKWKCFAGGGEQGERGAGKCGIICTSGHFSTLARSPTSSLQEKLNEQAIRGTGLCLPQAFTTF